MDLQLISQVQIHHGKWVVLVEVVLQAQVTVLNQELRLTVISQVVEVVQVIMVAVQVMLSTQDLNPHLMQVQVVVVHLTMVVLLLFLFHQQDI